MAHEKLFTAKQAAFSVLEKVGEVLQKSELAKKYEGFKAVEESARKSGASNPAAVAASIGRKKYGKKAFQEAAAEGHKMGKTENPDKDADAKLGEKVEKDVEQHMIENKAAEEKEGHKMIFKKAETENKKAPSKPPERKEPQAGESESPEKRVEQQLSPGANPKEAIEGNNELAGTDPKDGFQQDDAIKGHLKLAKFIGRMEHKRSLKKDHKPELEKKEPTPWKGPNSSSTGVNAPLPTKETAGWHGNSQSDAGNALRHGHKGVAKEFHKDTLNEMKSMPKPKLPR